jgi:hypothetical protein
MKLRNFSVLFVGVLCFTVGVFSLPLQEIPNPGTGDEVLNAKIVEIMSILNMHRLYDLEEQTIVHFQKLLISNKLVFNKAVQEHGNKPHPLSQQLRNSSKIAAYWRELKDVQNFRFENVIVSVNQISDPNQIQDFEIDKEAIVTIHYKHNPSAGEISFTLYHMKRCTWD